MDTHSPFSMNIECVHKSKQMNNSNLVLIIGPKCGWLLYYHLVVENQYFFKKSYLKKGRHGEFLGQVQYSTPKFFDWLFLIRAYSRWL